MDITIREAETKDFEDISTLYTEELAYHIALKPDTFQMAQPIMTKDWFDNQLAHEDIIILVAECEAGTAGVVQVMVRNSPRDPIFKPRRTAHIEELIVSEQYRGAGVGRRLIQAAQAWAMHKDVDAIDLWVWKENKNAIGFYQHLGYESIRYVMELKLK
jgi:ribosomal protein S18 acetylase RimI-like enzyme